MMATDERYEVRTFDAPRDGSSGPTVTWYKVYHVNWEDWAFPLETFRTSDQAEQFAATAPPSPYSRRQIGADGLPVHCDRCRLPKPRFVHWRGAAVNVCADCARDLREEAESWGEPDEGRTRLDDILLPRLYRAVFDSAGDT